MGFTWITSSLHFITVNMLYILCMRTCEKMCCNSGIEVLKWRWHEQCIKTWINKCFKWPKTHNAFVSTDPPILDPVFQDVRSRNYQMVTLRCTVLRSNPPGLTDIRWFRNGDFIRMPMPDLKETPELKFKLEPINNGSYECRVSNSAGTSTCTYNVSG